VRSHGLDEGKRTLRVSAIFIIIRAGLKAQIKGAKSATESAGKKAKGANKKCKKEPF